MSDAVPVGCRCGGVTGRVENASPMTGNRAICYCVDCQAFAHFVGGEGILDANGGSDIFQVAPASLVLDTKTENLACVRLSEKGLHRWYASCCRTPIGNTVSAKLPFIGLVQPFMKHGMSSRDEAIGPPRMYLKRASAVGALPPGTKGVSLGAAAHLLRFFGGAYLHGRARPNPLYADDGRPVVTPEVLTPFVRAALTTSA